MTEETKDNGIGKREEFCNLLMDKVQRLTGALYRVTDLLSDKEPLKWSLREKAVLLMNNMMSVMSSTAGLRDKNVVFDEIKNLISQIEKILELTSIGTYTTNFNFDVLRKEYGNIQLAIEGEKELLMAEPKFLLGEALVVAKEEEALAENVITDITDKEVKIEDKRHIGQQLPKKETEKKVVRVIINNGGNSRSQKILDFLKQGGNKTVKEVSAILGGVSEKTAQRDLLALVASGQLFAKGEKRWRTYSVAG